MKQRFWLPTFCVLVSMAGCAHQSGSLSKSSTQTDNSVSKVQQALSLPSRWLTRLSASSPSNDQSSQEAPTSSSSASGQETGATTVAIPTNQPWWTLFQDNQLNQLVSDVLANNQDIQLASIRVEQSAASLGVSQADRYPAIYAGIDQTRNRNTQRGTNPLPPNFSPYTKSTRLTGNISWELDLWGRIAALNDAAKANLLASMASREAAKLSVAAQTTQRYFELQSLYQQEQLLRQTLDARQQSLRLQEKRQTVGLSSKLDIQQVKADIALIESQLAPVVRQREGVENALRLLLAQPPREFFSVDATPLLANKESPQSMGFSDSEQSLISIPEGLDSLQLLRRPDLQEAEQALRAADANLKAARAAFFPTIKLTAFAGTESADLSNLFDGPARIFNFTGNLVQPIFQAKKLQFQRDLVKARQAEAVAQYQAAIRQAFREVVDALDAQSQARQRFQAQSRRYQALQEALRLTKLRHTQGLSSLLDVIDTERQLLQSQIDVSLARQEQRLASVDLIKALGGDWRE